MCPSKDTYVLLYMEEIYMKLEVYDKCKKAEKTMYLDLKESENYIIVHLVNEYGQPIISGNLLSIHKSTGKVSSFAGITNLYEGITEYGTLKIE